MKRFVGALGMVIVVAMMAGVRVSTQAPRLIVLKANDAMKYDVTQLTAKPGESLKIRLISTGTVPKIAMAHNFVLLKTGADVNAFVTAAVMARDTDYIPASQKANILASTGLAGPNETVEVTFKAPAKPGKYQFLCSFAGHFAAGMTGFLTVK